MLPYIAYMDPMGIVYYSILYTLLANVIGSQVETSWSPRRLFVGGHSLVENDGPCTIFYVCCWYSSKPKVPSGKPNIAMEIHHFQWENPL